MSNELPKVDSNLVDVPRRGHLRAVLHTSAMIVAAALLVALVAYGDGQDAAIEAKLEQLTATRIGLNYSRFMENCGNENLILRRDVDENDRIHVVLRLNDYLYCIQHKKEKVNE